MCFPMRRTLLLTTLLVLPRVHAGEPAREPEAVDLLRRAVAAQGKLPDGGLQDLQITFEGQIREPEQGEHSITRKYWFRAKDRSFRIQTYANAAQGETRSERGVLGSPKPVYWEWLHKSQERAELRPTNREHLENIRAIQRDRDDFERIVRMVVLARAEGELTKIRRGNPLRVDCAEDQPNSRRYVFPDADRDAAYLVLDLERAGSDPLRLFLNEKDLKVRKVVQFDQARPDEIRFVYYLGGYKKENGLLVPHFVSVHTEVPTEATRAETTRLSGRLSLSLNPGLDDAVFSPSTPAKRGATSDANAVQPPSGRATKDG